jgi:epsilon-lactone hydrolase
MVSDEFRTFNARMTEARRASAPSTLQENRARAEVIMGALPLPEGVYAERVDAGGVSCIRCRRESAALDPHLLYFHGGGYRLGSALSYRAFGANLAKACGVQVLLVDYRLAPENPFPGAVQDATHAYTWLADTLRGSERIVVGGDSAGGGLAAAVILAAKSDRRPLPVGGVLLSPWLDLTNRADSYRTRAETDSLFSKASADEAAKLYLGNIDPTDTMASPLFGDWSNTPPLLIQASDAEVLIDDATALAEAVRTAGAEVDLRIFPDMPHVWPIHYPAYPEAVASMDEIASFVNRLFT